MTAVRAQRRPAVRLFFAMGAEVVPYVLFVVALVAIWWLLVALNVTSEFLLPSPPSVADELGTVVAAQATWSAVGTTIIEIVAAFGMAAIAGTLFGIPIGWYRTLRGAYEPLLGNLYAVPLIVLYPVFALALGLGSTSKIVFGAVYGFFPVAIATVAGVAIVNPVLVTAGRSMGARRLSLLRTIIIPAALPEITSGLRLGLVLVTLAVIGGEFIGGDAGLGYLLATAGQAFLTSEMFAYMIVTVCVAAALNTVLAIATQIPRRRSH